MRTIARFPNLTFHEDGRVISRRGVVVGHNHGGYIRIWIRRGYREYAHRLICEAFHGPAPSDRHMAAHWNGNRADNRPENLRWALPVENEADKERHGTKLYGNRNHVVTLTDNEVRGLRSDRSAGYSFTELSNKYGVCRSTAYNICAGITWRAL